MKLGLKTKGLENSEHTIEIKLLNKQLNITYVQGICQYDNAL